MNTSREDELHRLREALAPDYQVQSILGRGGMAVVYLARDTRHDRQVAVKVLRQELAAALGAERFLREIRIAAGLRHPHILPLFDSGTAVAGVGGAAGETELLFYVMPYVEGETLRDKMNRETQLVIAEAVTLACEIADALGYAHSRGIMHRDIKPENILLEHGHAVVADFGVARAITAAGEGTSITESGLAVGTPAYMSPEQASGMEQVDGRADVYALGCMLYEMVAGEPPFRGPTAQATMARHATDSPPSIRTVRPTVPPAMEEAVFRALAKVPADRFATAGEFADALRDDSGTQPAEKAPPAAPANSIAVLPFTDHSKARDQEYLCEGITEELIDAFGRVSGVHVASRTSVYAHRGVGDVRKMGQVLGVSTVLEGSVRTADERLRVSVTLTNVADGYQLWSERFDRSSADVFAIQDEIARTVVETLKPRLTTGSGANLPPDERAAMESGPQFIRKHTKNVEAYHLYLKGRHFWNRRHEGGLQKGIEAFRQALELDPGYALPYVGLADAFNSLGAYGFLPSAEAFPRARASAEQALRIDPELAEAHTSLGVARAHYDWDWEGGEESYRRAIELDPDYALAHAYYALLLCLRSRFAEALERIERAKALSPLENIFPAVHAWILYFGRRYHDALKELTVVLGVEPNFAIGHGYRGAVLYALGEYESAIEAFELAKLVPGAFSCTGLCYARLGQEKEARSVLAELEARSVRAHTDRYYYAAIYLGMGETERALDELEAAADARSYVMTFVAVDPFFDPLRGEERFGALLARMGLGDVPTPAPAPA